MTVDTEPIEDRHDLYPRRDRIHRPATSARTVARSPDGPDRQSDREHAPTRGALPPGTDLIEMRRAFHPASLPHTVHRATGWALDVEGQDLGVTVGGSTRGIARRCRRSRGYHPVVPPPKSSTHDPGLFGLVANPVDAVSCCERVGSRDGWLCETSAGISPGCVLRTGRRCRGARVAQRSPSLRSHCEGGRY